MKLVVTQPFAGREVGSEITDPEAIKQALETHASSVVKVADAPKAEAPAIASDADAPLLPAPKAKRT